MPFKAKDEKTTAQFLNWSAVKPLKPDAIFDGIRPILEGTFNLLILFWSTLKSCSSGKFNSFQILSIFFVVPSIKLCMGSMTTHAMKSKYGRWIKDENHTPFTLSFFSRPFFEVTELWTLQTCSLWSMLLCKSQLSRSNPEKSCFSPNDDLGNSFLHLLQPFLAEKPRKPQSLRDAGMSQVTQRTASRQNLGPVEGQSNQTPSQKSENSSTKGSRNEFTFRLGSWGPGMIPTTAKFSSLFLSCGGKFRKLK